MNWRFIQVKLSPLNTLITSLLNKVPRVTKCPSAQCPSALWVPKCLRGKVPNCLECPSAQVPFECTSASSAESSWVGECPSALWVHECLKCPSALSARVPWVPQVFECLKIPSASVSQLVSQPVIQLVCNADSVSLHS